MRVDILNNELFRKTLQHIFPELQIPKFAGIAIDSRKVQRGDIFLALKGENNDGHNYIDQVEHAGASIAILEKKNAELEKNKEELADKIEDLTDTIRTSSAQIENLNATADAFISEVESL